MLINNIINIFTQTLLILYKIFATCSIKWKELDILINIIYTINN